MRRILLCLAIVLLLGGVGLAASSGGATGAKAVAKQAAAAPDLSPAWEAAVPQTVECAAKVVLFEDPFSNLEASSVSASNCCIDRCRRDRDCDGVCGAKGAGACVMVNSCCKDCACAY